MPPPRSSFALLVLAVLLVLGAVAQLTRPVEQHPGRLGLGLR